VRITITELDELIDESPIISTMVTTRGGLWLTLDNGAQVELAVVDGKIAAYLYNQDTTQVPDAQHRGGE